MTVKTYKYEVETCDACPFFTLIWKVSERYQIRNRATIPCYICEHPSIYMLQLPNIIRVEGKPVNIKEHPSTWEYPDPKGVSIPDWCKLNDKKDPGVKVGITIIIVRDGKVLLNLRGDSCETARNKWACPGGRMDFGEDPLTTGSREIEEETTLIIPKNNLEFLTWNNEFFPEDKKHYISLVFFAKSKEGNPKVVEADKCKEWRWFDPDYLPENTFWAAKIKIEQYRDKIKNG